MSDLNDLMARINEINFKAADELSSTDIDVLIAYHRRNRANKAAGIKPDKPKVDLSAILNLKPKAAGPIFKGRL